MSEYETARKHAAPSEPRAAREHLERHYRGIGIPAVAAAAAQMARTEQKADAPRHELPACLRDDVKAA